MGLRLRWLGTEALTWTDLDTIVRTASPRSHIGRAVGDESRQWSLMEHLTALLIDAVRIGNWQRQGKASAPRPDPIRRPGADDGSMRIGKDPIPIRDFAEWWDAA